MNNVPVVAFFNNKGGVGKTSLVYHLSWMYAELGLNIVAADFDPQANLTSAFLDEDRLIELWPDSGSRLTIYEAIQPLIKGTGDIREPHIESIEDHLWLLPGDLLLSKFEDSLSENWPKCLDRDERSFRVMSAFWRIMQRGANQCDAEVILLDLGPNLGAINRAALIAADYVVIPLAPDLFSLQGLRNLGPTLRDWRKDWNKRLLENPVADLLLPAGKMQPVGYIVLQYSVRLDRPVKAYERWIAQIPGVYQTSVLGLDDNATSAKLDEHRLALLKNYQSLIPMAQEAHKPIFALKPADGAIGAHFYSVQKAYGDFKQLAQNIAAETEIHIPSLD